MNPIHTMLHRKTDTISHKQNPELYGAFTARVFLICLRCVGVIFVIAGLV